MASAALEAIAAGINTVGQARAVLGEAARLLREAFSKIEDVPGGDDVREAVKSLLNSANNYAQKIYGGLSSNADEQADPISQQTRLQVAAALQSAEAGLANVEESLGESYWDFPAAMRIVLSGVGAGLGEVLHTAGAVAGQAGAGLFSGLGIFWTLAIVGVLVVIFVPGALRKVAP